MSLRVTYRSAIQDLRTAFERSSTIIEEEGLVFIWAATVSEQYMIRLQNKEPMALVILAHYAVLLHGINGQWWANGRGSQLVDAISETLPAVWQAAINWPRDAVQIG